MERRRHPRVPLDTPYFAELVLADGGRFTVMLVDAGRGGLQLAFGEQSPVGLLGFSVTLRNLPPVLDPEGRGISGKVTWLSPQRCGVRFSEVLDIPEDQLIAVAGVL